jgi:hypothetical protein
MDYIGICITVINVLFYINNYVCLQPSVNKSVSAPVKLNAVIHENMHAIWFDVTELFVVTENGKPILLSI